MPWLEGINWKDVYNSRICIPSDVNRPIINWSQTHLQPSLRNPEAGVNLTAPPVEAARNKHRQCEKQTFSSKYFTVREVQTGAWGVGKRDVVSNVTAKKRKLRSKIQGVQGGACN